MYIARNAALKFGYVDYNGKTILPFLYDHAESFGRRLEGQPGWATVAINGRYGIIDLKGKIIIPAIYDYADEINSGFFMVQKDGMWGVYDETGKITVPVTYDYIYPQVSMVKTMAAVKGKKWGVIKADNTVVVPFEYALITTDFYGRGNFTGYKNDGSVLIDPDGKVFNKTEEAFVYSDDLKYKLTNVKEEQYGLRNKKNEVLLPTEYRTVRQLELNFPYFEVAKDDESGLFNADTKEWILPFEFESIYMADKNTFFSSTYVSDEKSTYKYYDLRGKQLFNKEFDEADAFSFTPNNYALVKQGKYWGAIDKTGKTVLPFDLLEKPVFGYDKNIVISKSSGFGVLDEKLSVIIPPKYVATTRNGDLKADNPFNNWKDEKYFVVIEVGNTGHGIIKKDGTMAVQFGKYERISSLLYKVQLGKDKYYLAEVEVAGDKKGVLNINTNKILVPTIYDYTSLITTDENGIVTIRKNKGDLYGLYFINEQKEVVSPEFTYYQFDEDKQVFIGIKDIVYTFSGPTGKFGLVDRHGKKLTSMDYERITIMGNGYYSALKNGKVGILDATGAFVIPMEYDAFYSTVGSQKVDHNPQFINGMFYLRKGNNTILFDKNLKKVADTRSLNEPGTSALYYGQKGWFEYVESTDIFNNKAKPLTNKWLLNNKVYNYAGGSYKYDGSSLKDLDRYWIFHQGLIAAMRDGKYGYLDYTGKEVIPFEFDEATSFELTGISSVKKNNEWYSINRLGQRLDFTTITTTILRNKK